MEYQAMKVSEMQQTMDVEAKLRDADKLIARYSGSSNPERQLKLARTIFTKGALLIQARKFEPALAAFDLLLQTFQDNTQPIIQPQIAKTLLDRAAVLDILGRRDEALVGYDRLIAAFRDSSDEAARLYVASALFNKATLLRRLNRPPEALAALNDALDDQVKLPDRLLAKALWMKVEELEDSGRDNESLAVCQRLMDQFASKKDIVDKNWLCEITLQHLSLLILLDRSTEVVSAYKAAEEKFGPVAEEVMGKQTADYLVRKLTEHLNLNRMIEALSLAEASLAVFGKFVDPPWFDLAQCAGKARLVALCRLQRVEPCIAAYDSVVEQYPDTLDATLRRDVAAMLLDQSTAMAARRDYAAADKICDQILQRFKSADDPDLATLAARAMFNKIGLKAYLGRADEIMPACDAFIDLFRYSTHPVICEMLFHAWGRKAALLESQSRDADAIAAYDAALKTAKTLSLPALPVATILAAKAACLARLSQRSAQLETYQQLIHGYADNSAPGVRALVAPAMLAMAFMLREDGKYQEALGSCEQFIAAVERSTPAAMIVPLARAMFLRGELLEKLLRDDQAAAAYGALAGRFDFNGESEARKCIPVALFNQAALLEKIGRHEESLRVLDALLDRARGEPDLLPSRLHVQAMMNRAAICERLRNTDAALAAYQQVLVGFGTSRDPVIGLLVREALFKQAELFRHADRIQESLADYQELLARGEPAELPDSQKRLSAAAAFCAAALIARLGRPREAVAAYIAARQKQGDVADEWVRSDIAAALENLTRQDLEAGDFDSAQAGHNTLMELFQRDQTPGIQSCIIRAAELLAASDKLRQEKLAAALEEEKQRESHAISAPTADVPSDVAAPELPALESDADVPGTEAHPIAPSTAAPVAAAPVTAAATTPEQDSTVSPAATPVAIAPPEAAPAQSTAAPDVPVEGFATAEPAVNEPPSAATAAAVETILPPTVEPIVNAPEVAARAPVPEVPQPPETVTVPGDVDSPAGQLVHLRSLKWRGRDAEVIAGCDAFIKRFGDSESELVRRDVAEAFRIKIEMIKESGSLEDELRACNAFMLKFGRETQSAFAPMLCRTMLDRGRVFGQMDRVGHQIAAYDALMLRFGNSNEPALRGDIIETLLCQAAIAGQQARIGDEVRCYQKLVGKFGGVPDEQVQRQVATAMLGTAMAFRKLDRKLDELAVYDAIMDRFGKTDDTGILFVVARAMMRKALTQGERGKRQEQIAVCDAIIARFTDAESLFLRQQAARSQCNRAMALAEMGNIPEAMAGFDATIKQYADAKEPPLRACAGLALFQKAELLRKQRHRSEAISCYQHFIQSYQMDDEEISGLISQAQALLRVL